MKNTLLFIFVICISINFLYGQGWTIIDNTKPSGTKINLVSANNDETILRFELNAYKFHSITTQIGDSYIIKAPDMSSILEGAAPDLPKFTTSIIIPETGNTELSILYSNYIEMDNIDIAPSKGNFTRDIDPSTVPYTYGTVYSQNQFYPGTESSVKEPFILRDFRGQTVVFYPFQFNPITKKLRIYTEIEVKISKTNGIGINEMLSSKEQKEIPYEFNQIYKNFFFNYGFGTKYTPLDEGTPGNMLIICYSGFMNDMQPFIDWKREKGIETEIVNVTTIGNTAAQIKTYVANYYNTNGLVYLLLVGDDAQVTASSTGAGDSDVDYGFISGSDHYAELIVGRFSAETNAHVQTQVARTIEYEKNPVLDDWWTNAVGVASDQGPGDDNELDFEHVRNISTDLLGFTYTNFAELYDGDQGGEDAAGNPTPAMLATEINIGKSILVYTGHGSDTSFGTTGFSNTDVNALTNNNKYPFIFSVACVNGNFIGITCFAEAWLRATNAGQPSGAVATFMSTINQSWDPPMIGQDEMIDILTESYVNNIKRSFGGIAFNGCFQMNEESSDFNMTDTWTIFGDPSVIVRTKGPMPLTATHNSTITLGLTNFVVNCTVEGALVSVTCRNAGQVEILGTGYILGGTVDITIPAFTAPDTMLVTVTDFNYTPYIQEVLVIAASGPYVVYNSKNINDPTGNNNGLADYNEDIVLDLSLKNVGIDQATNVSATISTSNSYITITDNAESYGTINAGATATQTDAYALSIADGIADQTSAIFEIAVTDGTNSWPGSFSVLCNAPSIDQSFTNIDDSATGDGDGLLDPGETVDININTINNGHADSEPAICTLTSTSPWVTINSSPVSLGAMTVGVIAPSSHNITINAATPTGTNIDFTFTVVAGSYSDILNISLSVGLMIEDWESNSFTSYGWQQGGTLPWIIVSVNPYEGTFCAKSGAITHDQTSELIINMNVLVNDNLTFYKKVSCEQGYIQYGYPYDYLEFTIDGISMDMWDGEVAWSLETYPVTTGIHELKWIYSKDNIESAGEDCAWVDYIKLPAHSTVTYATYNNGLPANYELNIYPNPASHKSNIQLSIPENVTGKIEIFNFVGEKVKTIWNSKDIAAGFYDINFSTDEIENGVYFCKFISDNTEITKRFIIIR
ncbi:MAG: C25 family cysteine peptidase [Bacteroidota bacterium]